MHPYRVVWTKAGTELKDVAHHTPRHRTRGFKLDVIEAHLMKPADGKERRDFGRAVATGSHVPDGNHMGERAFA